MKRLILSAISIFLLSSVSAQQISTFAEGLKFCEGTVPYKNMMLVSNFGIDTCDPLNQQGKGYIMAVEEDGTMRTFIEADGNLNAPKGMAVYDGHLFVADVGKVVVYNLRKTNEKPQVITFPAEDLFVNDIVAVGSIIIVSVTHTGKMYAIDASHIEALHGCKAQLLGEVPGANGMAVYDDKLYIASYNPNETPSAENVIYVADISNPSKELQKVIAELPAGQYDGIAVSQDGSRLFFSSWKTDAEEQPMIYSYDLVNKGAVRKMDYGVQFKSPADISIKDGFLWVPDLLNSKLYKFSMQ